ncbi:cell division protein PerM [Pseudolysinimonas sp.]|uniref:cell division protein PerM n=1 Tax=Pseudolysinimonas sp. TaxID=2680009 RepID=UPI003F80111D
MTRRLTVLFSALEAIVAIAIGVAIPLVPLTLLWAIQFGFAPAYAGFWRAAVDVWLLGHGVDVRFQLDATTAASLGLAGADQPVVVTIALLGFALLTALLGARAGGRIAETGHVLLGSVALVVTAFVVSTGVTLSALHVDARPSIWQGALLPTLTLAVGAGIGLLAALRPALLPAAGALVRAAIGGALRTGAAAVALLLGVSAITVALLVIGHYGQLIRLYEALHTGVVGGLALTLGQLALLPDVVIWAASWFTGSGFALGAGSHVSPLGTAVGPVPAIPLLGAIPTGDLAFGFAGLIVPVVAGFLAGAAARPALDRALADREGSRWPALLATGLGGGVVGGLLMGLLAWAAAGSAGPGRLVQVGPDPLAVGLTSAAEIGVAALIGVATSIRLPGRLARGMRGDQ